MHVFPYTQCICFPYIHVCGLGSDTVIGNAHTFPYKWTGFVYTIGVVLYIVIGNAFIFLRGSSNKE